MEELIFGLIGGTALLMYGVSLMGDGLEKASGETMKKDFNSFNWQSLVCLFSRHICNSSSTK